MNYLVLLDGDPDSGKSSFASTLETTWGFHRIGLDELYCRFIKTRYPSLFMEDLSRFVGPHYAAIARGGQRKGWFPNILADWDRHVIDTIAQAQSERVVCEGYLLSTEVARHFVGTAGEGLRVRWATVRGHQLYEHVGAAEHEVGIDQLAQ